MEAAPINPSDLLLLLAGADPGALRASGPPERPRLTGPIAAENLTSLGARLDLSMPVGNEGAGVVVGAGPGAEGLLGRTVALAGGAMYAQYRLASAAGCLVLGEDASPADAASAFVNPLTALGMTVTMRNEGHSGLIHTAAASNLGQMLHRLCLADGIPLVNIVRSPEQARLLEGLGARHVLNSAAPDFDDRLVAAIDETGATLAFDAVGGGALASRILSAMEIATSRRSTAYSGYGSSVLKQIYIYGVLDPSPTVVYRDFGLIWGMSGWLVSSFLAKIGPEAAGALRQRVAAELKTTFASRYAAEISLAEALDPSILRAYARHATGAKYLINPHRPA